MTPDLSLGIAIGLLLGVALTIAAVAGAFWIAGRVGRE